MKLKHTLVAASLLSMATAHGASIAWGAQAELTAASDLIAGAISTVGVNGGNDAGLVVNGVAYENFESPAFAAVTSQPASLSVVGTTEDVFSFASIDVDLYSPLTFDVGLDTILDTHVYGGGTTDVVITLSNLQIGAQYRVQVVAPADDRGCCSARTVSVDGLVDIGRFVDLEPDLAGHVGFTVGSFTADATTQDIVTSGAFSGGFSALVLAQDTTVVPEPTSLAFIAFSAVGLVIRRRKP